MPKSVTGVALAMLVALVLPSCDVDVTRPNRGTYFRVSPRSLTLLEGHHAKLRVDSDALVLEGYLYWDEAPGCPASVFGGWSSQFPDVGKTEAMVVGVSPGAAGFVRVEHLAYGWRDSCQVTVLPSTPAKLVIRPDSAVTGVGDTHTLELEALVLDSYGEVLYRPGSWTWQCSDSTVLVPAGSLAWASVNSWMTYVWGLRPGRVTVSATLTDSRLPGGALSAGAVVNVE